MKRKHARPPARTTMALELFLAFRNRLHKPAVDPLENELQAAG
jgi:hypothetical protein